jgi:hypothetical protein
MHFLAAINELQPGIGASAWRRARSVRHREGSIHLQWSRLAFMDTAPMECETGSHLSRKSCKKQLPFDYAQGRLSTSLRFALNDKRGWGTQICCIRSWPDQYGRWISRLNRTLGCAMGAGRAEETFAETQASVETRAASLSSAAPVTSMPLRGGSCAEF